MKEIKGQESELNLLFKEVLDGLRDDLVEADENVQLYLNAIVNDPGGKELYGSFYNDALKIKGSVRDKQLKFLALIKDRVAKKEDAAFRVKEEVSNDFSVNNADLNNLVSKLKTAQGENVVPHIDIAPTTAPTLKDTTEDFVHEEEEQRLPQYEEEVPNEEDEDEIFLGDEDEENEY